MEGPLSALTSACRQCCSLEKHCITLIFNKYTNPNNYIAYNTNMATNHHLLFDWVKQQITRSVPTFPKFWSGKPWEISVPIVVCFTTKPVTQMVFVAGGTTDLRHCYDRTLRRQYLSTTTRYLLLETCSYTLCNITDLSSAEWQLITVLFWCHMIDQNQAFHWHCQVTASQVHCNHEWAISYLLLF